MRALHLFLRIAMANDSSTPRRSTRIRKQPSRSNSDQECRAVFDAVADVIMVLDKNCRIVLANKAAVDFIDRPLEKILGAHYHQVLHGNDHSIAECPMVKLLASHNSEDSDYYLDKKGIWVRAITYPSPDEDDTVIHIIRDVTRRHLMEQELKYKNILLDTQQQNSLDGILIVNQTGTIVSYNQRFIEIWELPEDIVLSRSNERAIEYVTDRVVNSEAANAVVRSLYEPSQEKSHDEISLVDGRTLDRYSAPMMGEDRSYYGRVWYFRDITQYKKIQEEILQTNAQLTQTVNRLEERNMHNSILSEMREMLQACASSNEVASIIRRSMAQIFPHASGDLFMLNESKKELESVIHWREFHSDLIDDIFAPDDCWSLRRGRVYLVEDASLEALCPHLKHPPTTPHACLPLMAKGEILGMLHLRALASASMETQAKTVEHFRELATTISEYLSLSIANIRLREQLAEQSVRDPLTGLFNRRYMEESLKREILRAAREQATIGIVMTDIDFFKRFNDRYGHSAGDELLARIGQYLRSSIRGSDVVCRYGGEEFILFLPECNRESTYNHIERIREGVLNLDVEYHGIRLEGITLSFGIAIYPDQGTDAETLINAADGALYRAKEQGRNCVVVC